MANLSGAKFHFNIHLTDGQIIDVHNRVGDVIVWEKANKKSWAASDRPEFGQLLWVGWAAARREGKTEVKKFDDFAPLVDDFELVDDDEDEQSETDPTQPEASTE